MLGFDRRAARAAWTILLVLLLAYLAYLVRFTLFIFVLALFLAHLLSPLVDLIDRFLPASRTRTRTPALALAYLIFVGLVVTLSIQLGSVAATQAKALAKGFPDMLRSAAASWQNVHTGIEALDSMKEDALQTAQQKLGELASALPSLGVAVLGAATNVIFVVIIPVLSFFFLKDAPAMREHVLDLVSSERQRALLQGILSDLHLLLVNYMRALVILSASAFTAYAVFFVILGVPYAILLAALGGLLEVIPMLGPLVAGATIVLIAAISGGHFVPVVIFLVLYRMMQDYIISPHVMERGVAVHPLLVLFGVFAGAEIAGIAGTFLSVPVLAMIRIVYLRIHRARVTARLTTSPNAT